MAWRSSGTTNSELVDNLMRFGVISSPSIERGFRQVDREHFVPQNNRDMAHSDQPLKEGNIHISAPHIYGSVLEALELHPDSSLSFLNIGSGTGYVSCIVASILGPHSSNYAIEIHRDVVQHSIESMQRWKDYHASKAVSGTSSSSSSSSSNNTGRDFLSRIPHIEWIHGNALNVDLNQGEAVVGFDRIYVGASIEKRNLSKITNLLRPGGVLVGPVDDELVKVVRIGAKKNTDVSTAQRRRQQQHFDTEMDTDDGVAQTSGNDVQQFTQQSISGVRFAPLLENPNIKTVLPSRVWSPSIHQNYPDSFRKSCKELLLCSNANQYQSQTIIQNSHLNLAGMLPRVLWMEILSYTHRDWFEPPVSEAEFLRRRLLEEQANAQRAHQARLDAETRCHIAEQERDVYRVLARRCQLRLENLLNQRAGAAAAAAAAASASPSAGAAAAAGLPTGAVHAEDEESVAAESIEDAAIGGTAAAVLLSGREQAVIFGLGAMLRSIQYGEDEEDHLEDIERNNHDVDMEEDELPPNEEEEDATTSMVVAEENVQDSSAIAMAGAVSVRPQARTVSISGENL